jgi:hypothetical protein
MRVLWFVREADEPCKVQGWPWRGSRGAEPLVGFGVKPQDRRVTTAQSVIVRISFSVAAFRHSFHDSLVRLPRGRVRSP